MFTTCWRPARFRRVAARKRLRPCVLRTVFMRLMTAASRRFAAVISVAAAAGAGAAASAATAAASARRVARRMLLPSARRAGAAHPRAGGYGLAVRLGLDDRVSL